MSMTRQGFLELLAAGSVSGMALDNRDALATQSQGDAGFYDGPRFGNVSLLHFTDCHAQLLPSYFREPDTNIGAGDAFGKPPHLTGEALLKHFRIPSGTRLAHAFTHLDFVQTARNVRVRCCSTAATVGKAPPPRCGPRRKTWRTPAYCSAWTS